MKDGRQVEGRLGRIGRETRGRPAAAEWPDSRRLPGEDPASPHPDDAEYWAAVYAELQDLFEDVLAQLSQGTVGAADHTASERVEGGPVLWSELERFRAHREYWERRCGA